MLSQKLSGQCLQDQTDGLNYVCILSLFFEKSLLSAAKTAQCK